MNNSSEMVRWTPFKVLQGLGYLLGAVVPLVVFFLLKVTGLLPNILPDKYMVFFFWAFAINIIFAFGALLIEHIAVETHGIFSAFFYLQAITSVVLIHLLVILTGGPKTSIFVSTYLYFPAIVGYVYGSKGIKLKGASILLSISYVVNLFLHEEQLKELDKRISSKSFSTGFTASIWWENFFYLFLFLIQIIVTTIIAAKSKKIREQEKIENTAP